jgi:hypothetical protein
MQSEEAYTHPDQRDEIRMNSERVKKETQRCDESEHFASFPIIRTLPLEASKDKFGLENDVRLSLV